MSKLGNYSSSVSLPVANHVLFLSLSPSRIAQVRWWRMITTWTGTTTVAMDVAVEEEALQERLGLQVEEETATEWWSEWQIESCECL